MVLYLSRFQITITRMHDSMEGTETLFGWFTTEHLRHSYLKLSPLRLSDGMW